MTDIHNHILPMIDDGAENATVSMNMLKMVKESGYDKLIFTPHYYNETSIKEFKSQVNQSLSTITKNINYLGIDYKVGAEVYLPSCPVIYDGIKELAIKGTPYILLELFFSTKIEHSVFNKIDNIRNYLNLVPIIAHVEQYATIQKHPELAFNLKEQGCLLQLNASSLFDKRTSRLSRALLKHNLIDVVASDAHNDSKRPFNVSQAIELIKKEFGSEVYDRLEKNADDIFVGKQIKSASYTSVKKFSVFYY